nr:MAG: DBP protein [unidentified adenovirus]
MSNYEALSSSGEEELVIDETPKRTVSVAPLPRKKRLSKRKHVIESDDEVDVIETPIETTPALPPKKKSNKAKGSSGGPNEEQKWQEVVDLAMKFMTPLKVDTKAMTMLFDVSTFECFRKACQSWLNEKKVTPSLTYSTHKTFVTVMARFLFDFVIKQCQLIPKHQINVSGAVIWEHKCLDEPNTLKCLHGSVMIQKEQVIEMDVTSENGQRALKEQSQRAKVTTNRWGRNIVQLKNNEAAACMNDANTPTGSFSNKSCGLFYTEMSKAIQAFNQIMAYQQACYPKMPAAGTKLLMPLRCDCNYLTPGAPLLGRQTCKITPFSLTSASGLDESSITDPAVLASVKYPAVLVFQCCNPVYRGSKASAQKNCDFKISAPDVVGALQLAKQFWNSFFENQAPLTVPEFKWLAQYQYQNSILPTPFGDADDSLF